MNIIYIINIYYMKRTKSNKKSMRRTIRRSKSPTSVKKSKIVHKMIEMLNVVKLYHWKTHSFSQHKATDELYSKLNENVDKFVEVLLGKDQSRIVSWEKKMEIIQPTSTHQIKDIMYEYRRFLIDLSRIFDAKRDTDLLNIRDEILGDINQFLYLLSFH